MRRLVLPMLTVSALIIATAVSGTVAAGAASAPTGEAYTPLSTPVRVANSVALSTKQTKAVSLAPADVPTNATSVALTITPAAASAAGYLTVFRAGATRPGTSSVNFAKGQTVANLAVAQVGVASNGQPSVAVFNGSVGSVRFYLDVAGYYTSAGAGQGSFGSIAPTRVLNTSTGVGAAKAPLSAHRTLSFRATGGATGIPNSASAVLINVTAARPTRAGYLTAYASSRPSASTLNFAAGATLAHLSVVPVTSAGRVSLYNGSGGTVQVYGDVVGWFAGGDPTNTGALGVLAPDRLLSSATVGSHRTVTVTSAGRGGVPKAGVSALALNIRVAAAPNRGYLAVDPGSPVATSNLNFVKGQSVANLVLARTSSSGTVRIYNGSASSIRISADVTGYVLGAGVTVPPASVSRYVRNIDGSAGDVSTMQGEGRSDCASGSSYALLDIGAQSNTNSPASSNGVTLSSKNPGVRLSVLNPPVRLTYAQLVTALEGYLDGFAPCPGTIAISTNNDGDWAAYPAAAKASDWATKVVVPLQAYVTQQGYSGEQVVGASDIEPNFASTAAQARTWVSDYLKDAGSGSNLVYNGSAGACPTTYGSSAECAAVAGQSGPTWTRADFVALSHGIAPGRIVVLPQIYYASQAVQWANLYAYSSAALEFAGSLTEHASACGSDCAFYRSEGWAALQHALSTVVATPSIPASTDLQVDAPTGAGAVQQRPAARTSGDGA